MASVILFLSWVSRFLLSTSRIPPRISLTADFNLITAVLYFQREKVSLEDILFCSQEIGTMFFTEKSWLTHFLMSHPPSKPIFLLEFLKSWLASSIDVGYKAESNCYENVSPGNGREASPMIAQQHDCLNKTWMSTTPIAKLIRRGQSNGVQSLDEEL